MFRLFLLLVYTDVEEGRVAVSSEECGKSVSSTNLAVWWRPTTCDVAAAFDDVNDKGDEDAVCFVAARVEPTKMDSEVAGVT